LNYISENDIDNHEPTTDTQTEADNFYKMALDLLNKFYPEKTITTTTRDPAYVTPGIKAKLRKKNKLMRAGRVEEAGALAVRIGKDIMRRNKTQLCKAGRKTDAKDMWAAVRELTGRKQECGVVDGVSAETLNCHYATISTDASYTPPLQKFTVATRRQQKYVLEMEVFHALDHLRPTATGLDGLPAWFLRLGAPVFCAPISRLLNLSLATSTVPQQWKQAYIRPIPKIATPKQHADFRPISITPVLTRMMERTIVRQFIYPAFFSMPSHLSLHDQFAFRPTGSTTAALISLLNTVTNLLASNPYVIVICLDFSKAFDTVKHSTLLDKLAQLDMPEHVYNWLVDFFSGHSHCTIYRGQKSTLQQITASVIQGSGVGPAVYVVNAADLAAVTAGNVMVKFADDTYIVIPAANVDSRQTEIDHAERWAAANNLKVNKAKYNEIIFTDKRRHLNLKQQLPSPLPGIKRATSVKILGVTITSSLSVAPHVHAVISSGAQTLFALRVLRGHGMDDSALQTIFRSTAVARLQYASSAWWGFTTESDRQRIDAFIRRSASGHFVPATMQPFQELCKAADEVLFKSIVQNQQHVLHYLLPPQSQASRKYSLRPRKHNFQLPTRITHLIDCNFINRLLYSDAY
jgi:hypothetical protein